MLMNCLSLEYLPAFIINWNINKYIKNLNSIFFKLLLIEKYTRFIKMEHFKNQGYESIIL